MAVCKLRLLVVLALLAGILSSCTKSVRTFRKDGRTVTACEIDTQAACVLSLSYLRKVDSQSKDPIYFDRTKTIVYVGDAKGSQFDFQPFTHVDCSNGNEIKQHNPPQHNDQPFKTPPTSGHPFSVIDPSQFDADDGQCYKHVIKGKNGEQDVDPHIIIGG